MTEPVDDDEEMFVIIVEDENDDNLKSSDNYDEVNEESKDHAMSDSDETYVEEIESPEEESHDDEEVSKKRTTEKRRARLLLPFEQESLVKRLRDENFELAENEHQLVAALAEIMNNTKSPSPPDDFVYENDFNKFVCATCGLEYRTKITAKRHWLKLHGPRYCICYACGADFRDISSLYRHELRCNSPDAKVVLKARALTYEQKNTAPGRQKNLAYMADEYRKTNSIVHQLREQNPELADNEEELVKKIKKLISFVTPPDPPPDFYERNGSAFECKTCRATKESLITVTRHWQEQHGPRYLKCLACGWKFRCPGTLYKHERRCNAPDARIVLLARSRILNIRRLQKRSGNDGQGGRDGQGGKELCCFFCGAAFNTRSSLQAHERAHTGERPYRCQLCPAAYTSAAGLYRHKNSEHTDETFMCDKCEQTFKSKECLRSHVRRHLPTSKHKCSECGRVYAQKTALRIHVDRDHRHLPPPCACQMCPKRYPKMSLLKKHMQEKHGMTLMTRNMFYRQLPHLSDTDIRKIVSKVDVEVTVATEQTHQEENKSKPAYEETHQEEHESKPEYEEISIDEEPIPSEDMIKYEENAEIKPKLEDNKELLEYIKEVKKTRDKTNKPSDKPFVVIKDQKAVFVDGSNLEFYEQNAAYQNMPKDENKVRVKQEKAPDISVNNLKATEAFQGEIISQNNKVVALKNFRSPKPQTGPKPQPATTSPKTKKKLSKRKRRY